ncbi:MAG: ribonuclease HII [Peptococcaceae bacterium]
MVSTGKSIKEIKILMDSLCEEDQKKYLKKLSEDKRKTIKDFVKKYQLMLAKKSAEKQRLLRLWELENNLFRQGYHFIAGVDEAGRGPLAGPVVAGAVILPPYCLIEGLKDSKQITEQKRIALAREIKEQALFWSVGVVDSLTIDKINILEATRYAMSLAVSSLGRLPQYVLVDGAKNPLLKIPHSGIIKGDNLSASIAAASILAKTHRDRIMQVYDCLYPGYAFAVNKGYGTAQHLSALEAKAPCPIHRRTFAPVKTNVCIV